MFGAAEGRCDGRVGEVFFFLGVFLSSLETRGV